jgi:hypothetical protein
MKPGDALTGPARDDPTQSLGDDFQDDTIDASEGENLMPVMTIAAMPHEWATC